MLLGRKTTTNNKQTNNPQPGRYDQRCSTGFSLFWYICLIFWISLFISAEALFFRSYFALGLLKQKWYIYIYIYIDGESKTYNNGWIHNLDSVTNKFQSISLMVAGKLAIALKGFVYKYVGVSVLKCSIDEPCQLVYLFFLMCRVEWLVWWQHLSHIGKSTDLRNRGDFIDVSH